MLVQLLYFLLFAEKFPALHTKDGLKDQPSSGKRSPATVVSVDPLKPLPTETT
jgi:hypothetical protein